MHDIKHDGYRLMVRREPVSAGVRLLTRNEHDWTSRYPLIVQAVNKLKARSCLRHCGNDQDVVLVAFDLLQIHFALGRSLGALSVAGRRLVIPAVSLLAETLLPHMREQADGWQSSHANMSKNVTISPMTVQSMSCPSTLNIGSSQVPHILDSKRLTKLPFGNSVCWLRQLFYS